MICASLILGLHLASYHTTQYDYQNNSNPGIYAECDGWAAGTYRNTFSKTSVYAGYSFREGPFALTVGAVSGYKKFSVPVPCAKRGWHGCHKDYGISSENVIPLLAPSVTAGPMRLWYLPKIGDSSSVWHLSVQRKWK